MKSEIIKQTMWTQNVSGGLPSKEEVKVEIPRKHWYTIATKMSAYVRLQDSKIKDLEPTGKTLYSEGTTPEEALYKAFRNAMCVLAFAVAEEMDGKTEEVAVELVRKWTTYIDKEKMFPQDYVKVWSQKDPGNEPNTG